MPTVDQIISLMPDKVQVIIRAPHFAVSHNSRVYWQKTLVERDVAPVIIDACENGVAKRKEKEASLNIKISELESVIEEKEKQIKKLESENKSYEKKIDDLKNSHFQFSTEAEMLLND